MLGCVGVRRLKFAYNFTSKIIMTLALFWIGMSEWVGNFGSERPKTKSGGSKRLYQVRQGARVTPEITLEMYNR